MVQEVISRFIDEARLRAGQRERSPRTNHLDIQQTQGTMRFMKVQAPQLAPVLRSSSQGRLLAALMLNPEKAWTLTELAGHVGVDSATASREIRRAVVADIVSDRRVGQARLVSANPGARHFAALRELVLAAFGPPAVIGEEFGGVEGVVAVVIFGSWAARSAGVPGPPPGDVDVLVLGDPERDEIYDAAERAERRVGIEVNPTIRSVEEWASGDQFLADLRTRPHEVLLVDDSVDQLEDLRAELMAE